MVSVAALLGAAGCSCSDEDGDGSGGSAGSEEADSGGSAGEDSGSGGNESDDDETGGSADEGGEGGGGGSAGVAGSSAGQGGEAEAGTAGTAGAAGASAGSAGASAGSVGAEQGGGGQAPVGGTNSGGAAQGGGGGAAGSDLPPTPATLEDLIGAICDWEFRCCDRGELNYRLGDFVGDAVMCQARFVQELSSNSTTNPHAAGSALGLLGTIAYTIDLSRVEVNSDNLTACVAQYEAMGCNVAAPAVAPHCPGPVQADQNPCTITNLFSPVLETGDRCTLGLAEGHSGGNDVECVAGTTCLDAAHGSPETFPTCVTRGVGGSFCTNDTNCDHDFYCNPSGVCAEKGDVGEDCSYVDPDEPVPGELALACKAGLQCHPVTRTCVDSCTEGYICNNDLECPDGQSCAPLTVPSASVFHACRPLGESTAARCDDSADCETSRYCKKAAEADEGVCQEDEGSGGLCANSAQCADGLYCFNDGETVECRSYAQEGGSCVRGSLADGSVSDACSNPLNPMLCTYDAEAGETVCATQKLEVEGECELDSDCQSGMCELASEDAAASTCIRGAEAGDDCDDDVATADALRCGPGLACIEGECVEQVGPGGSCENEAGEASSDLCANGVCADQWESLICSDAAVPVDNGGAGVTCDGV